MFIYWEYSSCSNSLSGPGRHKVLASKWHLLNDPCAEGSGIHCFIKPHLGVRYGQPCIMDEETKAQRVLVSCTRSHSLFMTDLPGIGTRHKWSSNTPFKGNTIFKTSKMKRIFLKLVLSAAAKLLSSIHVQLFMTLQIIACQVLLSVGIRQARILQWVAMPHSRGSSWPRDWTRISCISGRFFTTEPPGKPKLIAQET